MSEVLQPHETADNKEMRGFTWRQVGWIIGSVLCAVITIEATLLGIYNSTMHRLADTEKTNEVQAAQLDKIRVDLDLMKVQVARLEERIESDNTRHMIAQP